MRLYELRAIIRSTLVEMAMHDHAREIERLYREFMSVIKAICPDLEVRKGPYRNSWIFSGEQLEIPELASVDFLFYNEGDGIAEDEPYGMYSDTSPAAEKFHGNYQIARMAGAKGSARDVPESDRRYTLSFQHGYSDMWSRQKFVRLLPTLIDHTIFFHEVAHLITSRLVPSKVHVNHFFPRPGQPDYEEAIGNFVDVFDHHYAKYANSPKLFVKDFPTFKDFMKDTKPYLFPGAASNTGLDAKEAEKWVLKKAYAMYQDLSGEA